MDFQRVLKHHRFKFALPYVQAGVMLVETLKQEMIHNG